MDPADVGEPQAGGRHRSAGRRHPPASRGVAERCRDQTRRSRRSPSASSPPAKRRRRPSSRPATATSTSATDRWVLNYMLHNLTSDRARRSGSPTTSTSFPRPRRPQQDIVGAIRSGWTCRTAAAYPVFDVIKGTGTNGTFTYPDQATDPYPGGPPKNMWTGRHRRRADRHRRPPPSRRAARRPLSSIATGQTRAPVPSPKPNYFEPAGAVSWDVAMTVTNPTWRVAVHQGDTLRISTPMTRRAASWYESMGIMVVWMADGARRRRPVHDEGRRARHPHPRPPARERQPRRADATLRPTSTELRRRRRPTDRHPHQRLRVRAGRHEHRRHASRRVKAGQSLTFINDDSPLGQRASGTRSPRARRRATSRPASPTHSPTPTSRSTRASSAPPARPPPVTSTGRRRRPAARHLHLLLPDPPVHAGCVRGDPSLTTLAIVAALAFAVTMGMADAGNASANLVASHGGRVRVVLALAFFTHLAGALLSGTAVASTVLGAIDVPRSELATVLAAGTLAALGLLGARDPAGLAGECGTRARSLALRARPGPRTASTASCGAACTASGPTGCSAPPSPWSSPRSSAWRRRPPPALWRASCCTGQACA